MERKISSLFLSLLVFTLLLPGCKTTNCPDGRPVQFQKCKPAQLVSRRVVLAAKLNLEYAKTKLGDIDVALATDAEQVTSLLTNRTVQFQSVLHAYCQSGNSDPCNLSARALEAKIEANNLLQTAKDQTDELKIVTEQIIKAKRENKLEDQPDLITRAKQLLDATRVTLEKPIEAEASNTTTAQ